MLENKFNKTDVVDIFDTLFYQDEKVDISEKLSDLYNSLYPDSEKEKMLYMLKHEYVFSFDECKKLQKQLPIYYDKTKGKKLDKFLWVEVPENIFSMDFIGFIEKMENSNLPIAGIYMQHENTEESTHYTLDEAKKTFGAMNKFFSEIKDEKDIYDVIENVLEKLTEDMEYDYQACDIDDKLIENGYLADDERAILRQSKSLYGVLVGHKAICSGIAKAVKQILEKYVLDVSIIHNEEHGWNQISVNDREKYNLDLTTAVVSKKHTEMLELLKDDKRFYRNKVYDNILEKCRKMQCTTNIEKIAYDRLKDNPHIYMDLAKSKVDLFRYIPKDVMYANEEKIIEIVKSDVKNPLYSNYCVYKDVPKDILLRHPEVYEMILKDLKAGQVELTNIPIEIQEKYPEECIRILEESEENMDGQYIDNVLAISKKILNNNPELCENIINDWGYNSEEFAHGIKKIEDEPIGIEWQNECLEEIQNQSNVILSAPTGSGKTKVFLQWALQKKEKPIYITAPIKALSNQRYRELKEQGYTVGLETGDIKNVPVNCDFICCTQEIYTNKYVEQKDATLIMDEFHYIFENPDRARTYIDALHNSKAKNILLCSATMGNIEKLAEYVGNVSKRKFDTYEGKSRLTKLEYKGRIASKDIKNALVITFSQRNIEAILEQLINERDYCIDDLKNKEIDQIIEKYKVENNELKDYLHYGMAGYYGRLLPKEKLLIEECFEKGLIDTVVGADALAMGVNFPVENVVFAQLAKYYDGPISKNLFEQIAGRAGRKGFFEKGNIYFCEDFQNSRGYPLESRGYDTGKLFLRCMLKQNEDISIELCPHIKNILKGNSTIEEEAEFISRYSFPQKDFDETIDDINDKMDDIVGENVFEDMVEEILDEEFEYEYDDEYDNDNYYDDHYDGYHDDYYDDEYDDYYDSEETYYNLDKDDEEVCERREELLSLKEKFYKELPNAYFEGYSPKKNCKLFLKILSGVEPDTIIDTDIESTENFYDLLQFRKYVKSLPKQYRKGLTRINDIIDNIDETAMGGFGEKLDINEVIETLEMEEKLSGVNVMRVLKEQELEQKMAERVDIIDEQMKIAEQYGLEDY